MSEPDDTDEWLAQICDFNEASGKTWAARFEIAGPSLVAEAERRLLQVGATLTPNGPHQQYLVKFPVHLAREVIRIVVAQDGVLCERQSTIIDDATPARRMRRCAPTPVGAVIAGRSVQK